MDVSSLTSLPTDSLYKFMAISGLMILFISIILPEILLKNFLFLIFDIKKQNFIQKEKLLSLREKTAYLRQKADKNIINQNDIIASHESIQSNSDIDSVINDELTSLEKETLEIKIINIEIQFEVKKAEYLHIRLINIKRYQYIGSFLGFLLTVSGFYFWYTKIQYFVDASVLITK